MNTPFQRDRFHADGARPSNTGTWIWVFGSNLAGRHGAGAALVALESFGAQRGVGVGPQGRAYAIPTKDERLSVLPITSIRPHIDAFIDHAMANPDQRFFITRVGCGLAGYKDREIAPLFARAPDNCSLPENWRPYFAKPTTESDPK